MGIKRCKPFLFKQPVRDTPWRDRETTGLFGFRKSKDFQNLLNGSDHGLKAIEIYKTSSVDKKIIKGEGEGKILCILFQERYRETYD